MNYVKLREQMVEEQLRARGINDERVLSAFNEVPREYFVPKTHEKEAYMDTPLPIGEGQTISQPYTTAFMTQLMELKGNERVLEIGTGSGYSTAILSKLCKEVYSIEIVPLLAQKARNTLKRLKINNVQIRISDGSIGLREKAPYDAIVVTAAAPQIPSPLTKQLKVGGKLVVPVGNILSQQMLRIIKKEDGVNIENHGGFRFVPLVGEFGWKGGPKPTPRIVKEK